jgi:hypothetical protein
MVFLVIFLVIDVMMRPRNPLGFRSMEVERRTGEEVKCGDDGWFWSWLIYVVYWLQSGRRMAQPGPGSVSLMEGVLATKIGRRTVQPGLVEGP